MAHEWNKGVLTASSWHGLEQVEAMPDADSMIRAGETSGAWPTAISTADMVTTSGLKVPGKAVVATYADGTQKAHGAVKGRWTALDPKEWQETVRAAVRAGARPTGAFSLKGGSHILATFEIDGGKGTVRNHLNLFDCLNGERKHMVGNTSIRTVCWNTLSASWALDGANYANVRHTASIDAKAADLRTAIEAHVKQGEAMSTLYENARKATLTRAESERLFDALFPKAEDDAHAKSKGRAENIRTDALRAAARAENNEGQSVATLWNAATWLVDREPNGAPKAARGGADRLDSLLFGTRAERIQEVQTLISVIMADGRIVDMPAPQAAELGVNHAEIGRSLLDSML
jgi:hypothetical protein